MSDVKSLNELAGLTGARLHGDGTVSIRNISSIEEAVSGEITFVSDPKHLKHVKSSRASAVILKEGEYGEEAGLAEKNILFVKNPLLAAAKLLDIFRPRPASHEGIHPVSAVHKDATLGDGVSVGAYAVIEGGAEVCDGTVIYAGAYIGINAKIGRNCVICPGVVVMDGCTVGDRVVIHANSVIGSDGFGYTEDGGSFHKIPQTGSVRIEDDVEIGASVTVDRATMGETLIGRGTKVDNLVQIAHNVRIGQDSIVVAQVGIAGSATIGSHVMLGGQVGVNGHIDIGDGVMVGAKSGVAQTLPEKGVYSGYPAMPHNNWLRVQSIYAKLPEMKRKIAEMETKIEALEGKKGK